MLGVMGVYYDIVGMVCRALWNGFGVAEQVLKYCRKYN